MQMFDIGASLRVLPRLPALPAMVPAAAALPQFRMPRVLDLGVLDQIKRTMAPVHAVMRASEALTKVMRSAALAEIALAKMPTFPKLSITEFKL